MVDAASYGVGKTWEDRLQDVNTFLTDVAVVRWTAEKCGVQPWVVAGVGIAWIGGFLLWGFTGELVCTVVGLLYPMYGSFKALESQQFEEVAQWLRYWTAYAAMSLAENVFYRLLVWVPFYHLLRILVVLWLFLPLTMGANSIYAWTVGPALRRYSLRIDTMLARSAEEVRAAADAAGACEIRKVLRRSAGGCVGYLAQDCMEDLMMKELTKTPNGRRHTVDESLLSQASCRKPTVAESPAGARARVSSPVSRYSPGPMPAARENKENMAY